MKNFFQQIPYQLCIIFYLHCVVNYDVHNCPFFLKNHDTSVSKMQAAPDA